MENYAEYELFDTKTLQAGDKIRSVDWGADSLHHEIVDVSNGKVLFRYSREDGWRPLVPLNIFQTGYWTRAPRQKRYDPTQQGDREDDI